MSTSDNLIPPEKQDSPAKPDAVKRQTSVNANDPERFKYGVLLRGKMIGVEDVKEETGDEVCQVAMIKLKAVVLAKKEHKQRICIKVNLEGVELLDEKTNTSLYKHAVNRIAYIARDVNDPRAIGYIYKNIDNSYQYFAIKTEKQAQELFNTLKDLFDVVLELKNAAKKATGSNEEKVTTDVKIEEIKKPLAESVPAPVTTPEPLIDSLINVGGSSDLISVSNTAPTLAAPVQPAVSIPVAASVPNPIPAAPVAIPAATAAPASVSGLSDLLISDTSDILGASKIADDMASLTVLQPISPNSPPPPKPNYDLMGLFTPSEESQPKVNVLDSTSLSSLYSNQPPPRPAPSLPPQLPSMPLQQSNQLLFVQNQPMASKPPVQTSPNYNIDIASPFNISNTAPRLPPMKPNPFANYNKPPTVPMNQLQPNQQPNPSQSQFNSPNNQNVKYPW